MVPAVSWETSEYAYVWPAESTKVVQLDQMDKIKEKGEKATNK